MNNFWLVKEKEAAYMRVIRWAQKNDIRVEEITRRQILEALHMKDN